MALGPRPLPGHSNCRTRTIRHRRRCSGASRRGAAAQWPPSVMIGRRSVTLRAVLIRCHRRGCSTRSMGLEAGPGDREQLDRRPARAHRLRQAPQHCLDGLSASLKRLLPARTALAGSLLLAPPTDARHVARLLLPFDVLRFLPAPTSLIATLSGSIKRYAVA